MSSYKAVVGLNYTSSQTGEETRVEAGDKIVDMTDTAIRLELSAGNIVEVVEKPKVTKKSAEKKGGENGDDTGVRPETRIES